MDNHGTCSFPTGSPGFWFFPTNRPGFFPTNQPAVGQANLASKKAKACHSEAIIALPECQTRDRQADCSRPQSALRTTAMLANP